MVNQDKVQPTPRLRVVNYTALNNFTVTVDKIMLYTKEVSLSVHNGKR